MPRETSYTSWSYARSLHRRRLVLCIEIGWDGQAALIRVVLHYSLFAARLQKIFFKSWRGTTQVGRHKAPSMWPNDYFCSFCCRSMETVAHLFQECPVTRQIWTWSAVGRWASWPRLLGQDGGLVHQCRIGS
jgi:hypothetical protein